MASRRKPFRPRITIRHTGYSGPSRWQYLLDFPAMGGGIGQGGSDLVGKISLAWVVGDYCRWLRAMGSQIIKADGTVVQLPKEKTKQQPRY